MSAIKRQVFGCLRFYFVGKFGETGYFSGGGFFMDHALLGGLVDFRLPGLKLDTELFLRLLGRQLPDILDDAFDPGPGRLVAKPPLFILLCPFQG